MSLVANYSSSDSENEDDRDENIVDNKNEVVEKVETTTTPDRNESDNVNSLLKGLPAPRNSSLTSKGSDDFLEEEVKPKASQIADAPKPPGKKRQPVKISIPTIDSDSDEEKEPKQKRQKTMAGSVKCGLTALLPPPIHTAGKETNRQLLPYVFSKKKATENKPAPEKKQKVALKPTSAGSKIAPTTIQGIGSYGSDSDDDVEDSSDFFSLEPSVRQANSDSTNFFLLDSSSDGTKQVSVGVPKETSVGPVIPAVKVSLNLPPPINSDNKQEEIMEQCSDSKINSDEDQNMPLKFSSSTANAPLSFKTSPMSKPCSNVTYSSYNNVHHGMHTAPERPSGTVPYTVGPSVYDQTEQMEGYRDVEDISVLQQDAEFLKLQGKNQRGKEPIQIVDVNADDFISPAEYQKGLSEETEYRSSHKKKDGPTSQQKRKHQITYLAFQAKERELELKNSWSQNRMTKKQTQAKYGF